MKYNHGDLIGNEPAVRAVMNYRDKPNPEMEPVKSLPELTPEQRSAKASALMMCRKLWRQEDKPFLGGLVWTDADKAWLYRTFCGEL